MTCGCSNGLRRLSAAVSNSAAPLATTVTAFPCGDIWAVAQKNPSLINTTHYHLCLATHRAGQMFLDAGHWIWAKLRGLWNWFGNAARAVAAVAQKIVASGIGALNGILAETMKLLQWLDDQAAHALNYLMWTGIAIGGFILLLHVPDFVDAFKGTPRPAKTTNLTVAAPVP